MSTRSDALQYHATRPAGKIEVRPTKPALTQRDLTLAYTPGVAEPCRDIAKDPGKVFDYTAKGNLVAVVTDGTAVLGLGNIGPQAGKPVMEGKAVLFKRFAGIDVFDIELDSPRIADEGHARPVKAARADLRRDQPRGHQAHPSASRSKSVCGEMLDIPVFHDDQHGTAIIICGSRSEERRWSSQGKQMAGRCRIVCLRRRRGCGGLHGQLLDAASACSARRSSWCDSKGVIIEKGAPSLASNEFKSRFARPGVRGRAHPGRRPCDGADVFIGLSSGGNLVTGDMMQEDG